MKLIDYGKLMKEINKDIEADACKRTAQIMVCILNAPAVDAVPRGIYDQVKDELDTLKRNVRLEKGGWAREHRKAVREVHPGV